MVTNNNFQPTPFQTSSLSSEHVLQWQKVFTSWLMNYNSGNMRRVYQRAIRDFVDFVEERVDVFDPAKVKQWMVITWKESLKQTRLSQATINQKLSAVSAFYTVAVE
ncbi:MAG: site-specific integrase [Chloroflexota bacterium]